MDRLVNEQRPEPRHKEQLLEDYLNERDCLLGS